VLVRVDGEPHPGGLQGNGRRCPLAAALRLLRHAGTVRPRRTGTRPGAWRPPLLTDRHAPGAAGWPPCYGTVTPWRTTGPALLSSSVAWETPGGVIVSITLATEPGSAEQMSAVPPTGQTPKE